jgi:hypothetical protein
MARGMRNGTSPYAKYQKRPYRYSDAIRQWEREMGRKAHAEEEKINARAKLYEGKVRASSGRH